VVLRSTAKGGTVSKIVAVLEPGDADDVEEHRRQVVRSGVAELRGSLRSGRRRSAGSHTPIEIA
jgi:acyl-CoA hydrolase